MWRAFYTLIIGFLPGTLQLWESLELGELGGRADPYLTPEKLSKYLPQNDISYYSYFHKILNKESLASRGGKRAQKKNTQYDAKLRIKSEKADA